MNILAKKGRKSRSAVSAMTLGALLGMAAAAMARDEAPAGNAGAATNRYYQEVIRKGIHGPAAEAKRKEIFESTVQTRKQQNAADIRKAKEDFQKRHGGVGASGGKTAPVTAPRTGGSDQSGRPVYVLDGKDIEPEIHFSGPKPKPSSAKPAKVRLAPAP